MKRFYKLVSHAAAEGGMDIHLDGRPVKTPSGMVLKAPNKTLADAMVREWSAQGDKILPDSMPVTQILITAQDRIGRERAAMVPTVLAYLDTDLLCYRAILPHEVATRQAQVWDPWLVWFEKESGAPLLTTSALTALTQPAAAHRYVQAAVEGMDDLTFAVCQLVTALSGSLVLALAFVAGVAQGSDVMTAMRVEEDFKADIYNESFHGLAPHEEKKQADIRRDLDAAQEILTSLRKRM